MCKLTSAGLCPVALLGPASGLVLPRMPSLILGSSAIRLHRNSELDGGHGVFTPEERQACVGSLHVQGRQGPGGVSLLVSVSRGLHGGSMSS